MVDPNSLEKYYDFWAHVFNNFKLAGEVRTKDVTGSCKAHDVRIPPREHFAGYKTEKFGCYDFASLELDGSDPVPTAPRPPASASDISGEVVVADTPAPVVPRQMNLELDIQAGYYIPQIKETFVPYGPMNHVKKIISSRQFVPTYIFGETGLAKSLSVVQLAAKANREVIRINVNATTDEEDFIGGMRLVNGETVFQKGPLLVAMERGAILLIDEISALSPAHAFALFTALEGEAVFVKKTNERIEPKHGFNIIATDNTRGKGSTSGRWGGTNVQNDAFLDRFLVAIQYVFPTPNQELQILNLVNDQTPDTNKDLIKWANVVRKAFTEQVVDENISVRRLCSILQVDKIFKNLKTSINLSITRFEDETKGAIFDLYDKIVTDPEYGELDFDSVPEDE